LSARTGYTLDFATAVPPAPHVALAPKVGLAPFIRQAEVFQSLPPRRRGIFCTTTGRSITATSRRRPPQSQANTSILTANLKLRDQLGRRDACSACASVGREHGVGHARVFARTCDLPAKARPRLRSRRPSRLPPTCTSWQHHW